MRPAHKHTERADEVVGNGRWRSWGGCTGRQSSCAPQLRGYDGWPHCYIHTPLCHRHGATGLGMRLGQQRGQRWRRRQVERIGQHLAVTLVALARLGASAQAHQQLDLLAVCRFVLGFQDQQAVEASQGGFVSVAGSIGGTQRQQIGQQLLTQRLTAQRCPLLKRFRLVNVKPRQELPSIEVQGGLPQRQIQSLARLLGLLYRGQPLLKDDYVSPLPVRRGQRHRTLGDLQQIAQHRAQLRQQVAQRLFGRG